MILLTATLFSTPHALARPSPIADGCDALPRMIDPRSRAVGMPLK
jgi:hypothetical protein